MTFRVAVIGGGTGGLCLAQGLHRAGVEVAVYERSPTRTERLQGYRVHINPDGARALHDCLPPETWRAFLDTTGGSSANGFAFLTEQLEPLLVLDGPAEPPGPLDAHHSVSRITLHQVLSAGIEPIIQYGKVFERYERSADGEITVHFADGGTARADLLIGADGANSRVRRQFLPHAERVDVGLRGVVGKLPLTPANRAWLPEFLLSRANVVTAARDHGMFLAPHELDGDRHAGIGGNDETYVADAALFDNTSSYLMWAFATKDRGLGGLDAAGLRAEAGRLIGGWHPLLRRLVADTDPAVVSLMTLRTSTPVDPWPTTNITLLGDAIHSMTPFRGIGANTALRDANLLRQNIIAAHRGERGLLTALGDYERRMLDYGFQAVRESLGAAGQFVSASRLRRLMFRSVLRTAAVLPPLKRRFAN
ncbi:FAD-dependent oxidoreductase [Crossiella cryophila]|uniref:2-polyprenyl-6-methoxyphenol hydroxylase-like FAD-dependent oxidoreductase n=1 Tax=Crossiella cryophila TaxID=43355 RepID=A0A7W7FUZ5_9PSEU|nr:NAD(P)/FAD-dependent oxidoreductase [Crossiella cryophila]MBB4676329.1 2-polyprenyl-6-methoxyphenol hydroxylase-like FAD-dependent oxidoreductase [Crossiella cryophila]